MKKNKVLVQYTIVSLVVFLIVAGLHSFVFSRKNTDYLIKVHINLLQDIINQYVEDHPAIRSFFLSTNKNEAALERESEIKWFSNLLEKKNGISRIKLLNSSNKVVWRDPDYIVQKESPGCSEYLEALNGIAAYRVEESDKDKKDVITTGSILNIYIPIIYLGKVIGVMEMHEPLSKLKLSLNNNISTFWIIILVTGLVLYFSLFFIFYKADRKHSVMLERVEQTQDVTIFALAYQAELRDQETGKHLDRTVFYVHLLAGELSKSEKYCNYITDKYIADLVKSAPLHDIGKVGIPDSILRKPGSLSPEEFETMKKHCEYGVKVLEKALDRLSFQTFLNIAIQLVGNHHEKWDGSGYPKGLSKDSIPISGRIMALADVYDALRSSRPYKEAFSHDRCIKIISDGSGKHFDPEIVKAFLLHEQQFSKISDFLCD